MKLKRRMKHGTHVTVQVVSTYYVDSKLYTDKNVAEAMVRYSELNSLLKRLLPIPDYLHSEYVADHLVNSSFFFNRVDSHLREIVRVEE